MHPLGASFTLILVINKVGIALLLHRAEHFNSYILTPMLHKLSGSSLTRDVKVLAVSRPQAPAGPCGILSSVADPFLLVRSYRPQEGATIILLAAPGRLVATALALVPKA